MAMLTVRNLPDNVHRALRVRAAQHGRSTEAEVREILAAAVTPGERLLLGNALASIGQRLGLTNDDIDAARRARDQAPAEPPKFA